MDVLSIGRTAVSTSIKVARIPFDLANGLLGRRGLEVDAAEARVRETAGRVVGDNELKASGVRKRTATSQRERAAKLRADAKSREKAAQTRAAKAKANLSELEDRERLEQLEEVGDALGQRKSAQVAEDEAKRLGDAAARVKQQRKAKV